MSLYGFTCIALPSDIEGIDAVLEKKSTLGHFDKINLNPIGERKFLLDGCDEPILEDKVVEYVIVFYLYLDKKRGAFTPLFLRWRTDFT